jgi:2-oxoglutarate ferredoxin oxidoreductase subunit beta
MTYKDYVNWEKMPTSWCPGCAIGIIFKQLTFTLEKLDIKKEELVIVSGIGCSGRAAGYFASDSVHGTHGRAIPIAEGIKRANPALNVIVFSGDGDLVGIGGNHLIHSARRDIDLTVICINNETYGMTGGQMSPTTKEGAKTPTSPSGNRYYPINTQGILTSNKRHFYARSATYKINHLQKVMKEAIEWKGFAFVDAIAFCIENFGRRAGFKSAFEMLQKTKTDFKISPEKDAVLEEYELGIMKK